LPYNKYEKIVPLPAKYWVRGEVQNFTVTIKDTSAYYDWLFLCQHSYEYPYSNIILNINTTLPSGKVISLQREVPLALIDGTWRGRSVGNITTQAIGLGPDEAALKFNELGQYNISISHCMRDSLLPHINYIGMALQKAGQ
jgi:gliding motility-associated lipoprotein GldH